MELVPYVFVTAFAFNAKCQYLLSSNSAIAAEQVVLNAASANQFPLKSYLTAETGELSTSLRQFSFGTTRP